MPKPERRRHPRIERRAVDGVLLLDKPGGISSNHALQAVKRLYRAERAGHAGTLDPLATGLLPILLGEATKFGAVLLDADKEYVALVALGLETTTGDAEGEPVRRAPIDCDRAAVEAVLPRFRGSIQQIPPMHSALKHAGRPLYEYARAGTEIERSPRPVIIHALEIESWEAEGRFTLRVRCSKGTYIRTLAQDIGRALGCGGHLAGLRRTAVAGFTLSAAATLAELETLEETGRDARLLPVDAMLGSLPAAHLAPDEAARFTHGRTVPHAAVAGDTYRVYGPGCRFLGIATGAAGTLAPKRVVRDTENPRRAL